MEPDTRMERSPSRTQLAAKRCVDIVGSATLLVVASPVITVCALLVRVTSPGPVLFRQWRPGLGGHPFLMYKVRTMRSDADVALAQLMAADGDARREWESYGRLIEDPRLIPRIGRLLRRTSLDELPQLINVLRGDMSLVGPRPLPFPVIDNLPAEQVRVRETVRPGLTGLWQTAGRSDLDLRQLLALDEAYVTSWSLRLDLRILARTPTAVIRRRGAY